MTRSRATRTKQKTKRKRNDGGSAASSPVKDKYPPQRLAGLMPAWKSGESGNPAGRAIGSRNKLSEAFIAAVGEAWERHGAACLEWLAANDKPTFVHVALALIPKQAKLDVEQVQKPIYLISDRPLTDDEWAAKWCRDENQRAFTE
jgi:hypothetical protein